MTLATENEIRNAYQGEACATGYVGARFASELTRLLHDRQVAAVRRLMERVRPRLTLELAPGPGRVTRDLRPVGRLVCLEYNEGMIGQGRAACGERAVFVRGNGFRLPFAQDFDLVYSFRFIRHFHLEDRRRLYAQVRQVLKPGGCFLLDAVNERVSAPLRVAHPEEYPIHDALYRPEGLRAELADAGLEVRELEPVQKFFRWQLASQVLLGPRAGWLNRWVIRGLERLPGRNPLEWIVTCRRA